MRVVFFTRRRECLAEAVGYIRRGDGRYDAYLLSDYPHHPTPPSHAIRHHVRCSTCHHHSRTTSRRDHHTTSHGDHRRLSSGPQARPRHGTQGISRRRHVRRHTSHINPRLPQAPAQVLPPLLLLPINVHRRRGRRRGVFNDGTDRTRAEHRLIKPGVDPRLLRFELCLRAPLCRAAGRPVPPEHGIHCRSVRPRRAVARYFVLARPVLVLYLTRLVGAGGGVDYPVKHQYDR